MRRTRKKGFTLVELTVVLVILSILAAIAVPNLAAYIHLAQFRRNESYAKTMYLSAESALTYRRTGGTWEELALRVKEEGTEAVFSDPNAPQGRIYGLRLDAGEYSSGTLSGDGAIVAQLLEEDTYDKSLLDAAICVEIDVESGQVYSVFYGTACTALTYDASPESTSVLSMADRSYDTRRAERLGYYSVDDVANVVDLEQTKLKIRSISLVNSETLTLNWTSNSAHNDNDVYFEIKFYDADTNSTLLTLSQVKRSGMGTLSGDGKVVYLSTDVAAGGAASGDWAYPLAYDNATGRFTLTMDAMMKASLIDALAKDGTGAAAMTSSTSISRFGGALAAPRNIYATVQAFPDYSGGLTGEYTQSTALQSNTANSMFADGSSAGGFGIAAFRHLSNIRYMGGAAEAQTFTVTARSLDWTSDSVTVYETTAGEATTLKALHGGDGPSFPTIPSLGETQTLRGTDGSLLSRIAGLFTGETAIANVKLDRASIPTDGAWLGLFGQNSGTILDLRLTSPSVSITAGEDGGNKKLAGAAAVAGKSTGTLSGVTVEGVRVAADLSKSRGGPLGVGGAAGVLDLSSGTGAAKDIAVSGTVTGTLKSAGTSGGNGVGGIAGFAYLSDTAAVESCTNEAEVIGDRRTGGIVGCVNGATSVNTAGHSADLADCDNEGLVLSSADVSDADVDRGHYIGGVAGYAVDAVLEKCTSRSGQAQGYAYTVADKDKLKGRYVGGILGYGSGSLVRDCVTQSGGYVLGRDYVGGIVGGLVSSGNSLSDMIQSVSVTTNASYVIGYDYVGGIVGENRGESVIERCVNTGVAAGYGKYIGGIVGANVAVETMDGPTQTPTVKDCASYVSDTSDKIYRMVLDWEAVGDCAGGLAGYNSGRIQFRDEDGVITTRSVSGIVVGRNFVGGLVGFNDAGGAIDVAYTLLSGRVAASGDCVGGLIGLNASEDLLGQTYTVQPRSVKGRFYVGGAVGANVVDLSQDRTIDGIRVTSLGSITAEAYCGGLIGYCRSYSASQLPAGRSLLMELMDEGTRYHYLPAVADGTNIPKTAEADGFLTSNNNGRLTVKGTGIETTAIPVNDMAIRAYAYAGGIVGYADQGSFLILKDCWNKGTFDQPAAGEFADSTLAKGVDVAAYLDEGDYTEAAADLRAELGEGNTLRASIVGGVIGVNGPDHVIDHCTNTGAMNGHTALGGIVGLNEGLVLDCVLKGSMGSAAQDYVGGIVGLNVGSTGDVEYGSGTDKVSYVHGTVQNCATEQGRTVTGRDTTGGIVGWNMTGGTVRDCTSSANVTGGSAVGGTIGRSGGALVYSQSVSAGKDRTVRGSGSGVGGLIGVNTVRGTLQIAGTGGITAADSGLTVRGDQKVGGIAGINKGALSGTKDAWLISSAKLVRAANGEAGGVVGAQEGAKAVLSYVQNTGAVMADKNAAGGIVGVARAGSTLDHCSNSGAVTASAGYAGGVASENDGTIQNCGVASAQIRSLGVEESGAVCAVNHEGGVIIGSAPTDGNVTISGTAKVLGAVTGLNRGTVGDGTGSASTTVRFQPQYTVSGTLTVGGAVGRNEGGTIVDVTVASDFKGFSTYQYLGGVAGRNEVRTENGVSTAGTVRSCAYSGTIEESKGAAGSCYGGIAGWNAGTLEDCSVSGLTLTATGVYTATSTSTAEQKEALASHMGGIAGKNETTGLIRGCTLSDKADDADRTTITVGYGMVGGVTGYNKGTIERSGDAGTARLMDGVEKVSTLLANIEAQNIAPDTGRVDTQNNREIDALSYAGGRSLTVGRSAQMKVTGNGTLGGIAGYNAPSGALTKCASGNWLLINRSPSIGVGTGGIIGMNESEKDLSFLLNRAFVGRWTSTDLTDRFAGGIIGNQMDQTTATWTIQGCVNYGMVYCYRGNYAGGVVGQWTANGGTILDCYNYGSLQTTYHTAWVGASGGIVAQLYHASSGQDFNIVDCQNHGSMYLANGSSGSGANDSAGILGNVTAYKSNTADGGQSFTINVVGCVNGQGVEIYSSSMASGIVGFFSADDASSESGKIAQSTKNIILNIDRCRNYARGLSGGSFRGGIFGDRYGDVSQNTYIQNCFSTSIFDSTDNDTEIVSMSGRNSRPGTLDVAQKVGRNYYFLDRWFLTEQGASLTSGTAFPGTGNVSLDKGREESHRADARMISYGTTASGSIFAAEAGPLRTDKNDTHTKNYGIYDHMDQDDSYITGGGNLIKSRYNGQEVVGGRILFYLPSDPYGQIQSLSSNGAFLTRLKNEDTWSIDQYVKSGYMKGLESLVSGPSGAQMAVPQKVELTESDTGFTVTITDASRPLYYEGVVETADGKELLSGLRFFPTEKGQGSWVSETEPHQSGVTTGHFQLPEELRKETAGKEIVVKVRAVSIDEDVAPSEWTSRGLTNTTVLPDPAIRIQLYNYNFSTSHPEYVYRYTLEDLDAFQAFDGWAVKLEINGQTRTLDAQNTAAYIDGQGVQELKLTASAGATNGVTPNPVVTTVSTYTPNSATNYRPDATLQSLTAQISGDTLEDLTITGGLTVHESTVNTPPIYRVELVGEIGTTTVTFAYEDVLAAAGSTVYATFRDLPRQIFEASDLRLRAWYAASGLGPVYAYGDSLGRSNDAEAAARDTIRTYRDDGTYTDQIQYSMVLWEKDSKWDSFYKHDCFKETALSLKALPAPELSDTAERELNDGSLSYTFRWDQDKAGTAYADARYQVELIGVTADGDRVTIPTGEAYPDETAKSFPIAADSWNFPAVELTVGRIGDAARNEIGLSTTKTYAVQQRLERPGQPTVENPDINELVYRISWPAITDETGCGSYQIWLQTAGGAAVELGEPVPAAGAARYETERDLSAYAGQEVTLYLVAQSNSTAYADSPNGVSYSLTVPQRIGAPTVTWGYSWLYDLDTPTPAADFRSGGLSVTVTPDAGSLPPGGSTYLIRAVITDADGNKLADWPDEGVEAMTADRNDVYHQSLTGLTTRWAGQYIQFQARVSSAAGQVSSDWVTSERVRLPAVKLDSPSAVVGQIGRTIPVSVTVKADIDPEEKLWTAEQTTISWTGVDSADRYDLVLTDKNGGKCQLRITETGTSVPTVEVSADGTVWTGVTPKPDGSWAVTDPIRFSGAYQTDSGAAYAYACELGTVLQREADGDGTVVYRLILPNVSGLTPSDGPRFALPTKDVVQIAGVSVKADVSGGSQAYVSSDVRELTFR